MRQLIPEYKQLVDLHIGELEAWKAIERLPERLPAAREVGGHLLPADSRLLERVAEQRGEGGRPNSGEFPSE